MDTIFTLTAKKKRRKSYFFDFTRSVFSYLYQNDNSSGTDIKSRSLVDQNMIFVFVLPEIMYIRDILSLVLLCLHRLHSFESVLDYHLHSGTRHNIRSCHISDLLRDMD